VKLHAYIHDPLKEVKMKIRNLVLVLISILAVSCRLISLPVTEQDTPPSENVTTETKSFSAETASAHSVLLNWKSVPGAEKYLLDVRAGSGEFLPVAELPADQTSYEVVGVPDAFELTYRLRTQTGSGIGDEKMLTITTPAAEPNPLTIQLNDYEPIAWVPPTPDPNNLNVDPSIYFPPGFDPDHPEEYDPANAVQFVQTSADIGPEGGSLRITTPDGITFELNIPAGALDETTPISLTPVQTIGGYPLDGDMLGAVRIEPDGLLLDLPATLRISRENDAPVPAGMLQLGFGFDNSGGEFHLMPTLPEGLASTPHLASLTGVPAQAGPLADIAIQQLQGHGVGNATPKKAAEVIKKHIPTDAEDRLLNELAYGSDNPDLVPLHTRQRLIIDKMLTQAQSESTDWSRVTTNLSQLEILMNYYGKDPAIQADLDKLLKLIADRLSKMLDRNLEKCVTSDDFYVQAMVQKISTAKPGSIYDALKKRLDAGLLKDAAAMNKKCTLTLEIKSNLHVEIPGKATYDIKVQGIIANLKLKLRNGRVFITGQGDINYTYVQVTQKTDSSNYCDPWFPGNVNDIVALLTITRIDLIFADVPNGALQAVRLMPMGARDSGIFSGSTTCYSFMDSTPQIIPGPAKIDNAGGSFWYGYFFGAHYDTPILSFTVNSPSGGQSSGGVPQTIATYESNRPSFNVGFGQWSESTTFKLISTGAD